MGIASGYRLLGVDGGGTGCRVALSTADGSLVTRATGGPANFATDPEATIRNILAAVHDAAREAALADGELAECAAHVGLAGVMDLADRMAVADAMPFGQVTVSDDRATSVSGALGARSGILAAVGTGTIVAARSARDVRYFGGWGHHLADQASGGWLGRRALRSAMKAHDGLLEGSAMTDAILDHFGSDPIEAVHFATRATPGDYASFAPIVIDAAQSGDPEALTLMRAGADYLQTCFRRADTEIEGGWILCLAGGIGPHYASYLDPEFRARIEVPSGTALDGALHLARQILERTDRHT